MLLGLISLIIVILSLINERLLKLTIPSEIGLMGLSYLISIVVLTLAYFGVNISYVQEFVDKLPLHDIIMGGMICLLLFSGSCRIKLSHLSHDKFFILSLSLFSTFIAVMVYSTLMYGILHFFDIDIRFTEACMLGSIIAPTDPVSAMGILHRLGLAKRVSIIMEGESLFNDGVAVAFFVTFNMLNKGIESDLTAVKIFTETMSQNLIGAIVMGFSMGILGSYFLNKTKQTHIKILISLASVCLAYAISDMMQSSAPIAAVIVGVYFATRMAKHIKRNNNSSDYNQFYIFWDIIDKILNSSLYILIGFTVLLLNDAPHLYFIALASVSMALIARFVSVIPPVLAFSRDIKITKEEYKSKKWKEISAFVELLTWAGLKGGMSIALAIGTKTLVSPLIYKIFIISTFAVVSFSILIQGLTTSRLYIRIKDHFVIPK